MTSITVTAQPDSGALRLEINALETITAITRSDSNGVAEVRTMPGVLPWIPTLVEARRNLVRNASFEAGIGYWTGSRCTLNWYDFSGSPYWTGHIPGPSGTRGLRLTADGTGSTYAYSELFPVAAGEFVAAYAVGSTGAINTFSVQVWFYNAAGTTITGATATSGPSPEGNSVYKLLEMSTAGEAPADATQARVILRMEGYPAVNGTAYFDRVLAVKDATLDGATAKLAAGYFDGGSTSATATYSWAGAAYASQAIETVAIADLIVTDYEAGSGDVMYTAGPATASISWDLEAPWLFVPVMPAYSVRLKTLLAYSAAGESLGSVHELLGREDPVAVLRGMGTRRGTLRLYCGTFADALAVVEATRRGEVLMLRQPEHRGMDMYFTATGYGVPTLETDGAGSVFGVDISYVQLARPSGELSGSLGWTFAALAAAYPTFSALPGAYATFQDVLLNEASQ